MRQFYTSVLERRKTFTDHIETPPFETAWASEAIFFVRIEELADDCTVKLNVQISPDGMHWMNEGTTIPALSTTGDSFVKVTHFGGWLRLVGNVAADGDCPASATLTVHLALKE